MITFKQLQEKLSDKEYKEVDALLNRDTLLRGNLIKNYAQRGKFETMKARDTFRRIKKNEDGEEDNVETELFILDEQRRISLDQFHYFDHPKIGLLVGVYSYPKTED